MAVSRVQKSSILQGFPRYRSMLAGNAAYIPTSFESIATATGTGSSGTVTFSSIPSTYKSLQIRYMSLNSAAGLINIRFNGNSSAVYAYHVFAGEGSTTFTGVATSVTEGNIGGNGYGVSTAYPNVGIIDIHDYASTTKNKTVRAIFGDDRNGSNGEIGLYSSLWANTAAVNSVSLIMTSGVFNSGTVFSLYGIN
jgi:hypothetical protein